MCSALSRHEVTMSPETARWLLQLPATAGSGDVERSFRRLARELHPDHGGDSESFRRLLQARAVLHGRVAQARLRPAPVVIVHSGPWWRRLARALLLYVRHRRHPPPPRVR
ncbi:MAG: J domain-containing protein [Actinomycetota bacterium]|nr:J domain-containing protein [Actinomycetota bacterium]